MYKSIDTLNVEAHLPRLVLSYIAAGSGYEVALPNMDCRE